MPAISINDLTKRAAAGRLAPVYLLVGEDTVAVDQALEAIEAAVPEEDRAFAIERRYAGESGGTPLDIASSARMLPMLGDRRILVVLRAERFLKPKRASVDAETAESQEADAPAADLSPLEAYLEAPVDSTVLVFVATAVDRTRRLTKRLLDAADVVLFVGLGDAADAREQAGKAQTIVEAALRENGKTMDQAAMRAVIQRAGGDVTKLRRDVEKLVLYAGERPRIVLDDVLEVVAESAVSGDDWAVVNAIGVGDAPRALVEVARRLDNGESAHAVVGQLRWWVSNRLAQSAPGRVRPALLALLRTDQALKSSGGDERVLLERLVVELTR